ncbi:MAG: flagellar protein FlaG [Helicobacteraceae bacterium]|jgi:flagellar protein FlaG|nr:flagellar protein FlaG [Helicobacteraceae bacterium]
MRIANLNAQPIFKTDTASAQTAQKVLEKNEAEQKVKNASLRKEEEARTPTTVEELNLISDSLNDMALIMRTRLRFGYSEDINSLYLTVLDGENGDVIRQIPSEAAIKFAARMRELAGMLLDEKA